MRYHSYDEWEEAIDKLKVNRDCICPCCQEQSTTTLIDVGIGHNEYWGHTRCDSDVRLVSRCCEVDVTNNDLIN